MLLAFAGCSDEEGTNTQPAETPAEEVTYSASIELAEQFGFVWSADSSISLFSTTQNEMFAYNVTAGKFEKTDNTNPTMAVLPKIYGVHPYAKGNRAAKSGEITLEIPAQQAYKAEGIDLATAPMLAIAEVEATELEFKHLFGYVNILLYAVLPEQVTSLAVSSIKLTTSATEPISGTASFETEVGDSSYELYFGQAGSSQIVLHCGEGATLGTTAETATSFHFTLPAATYTNGCKVEITDTNGIVFEEVISAFTVKRGEITTLPVADIEYPQKIESAIVDVQFGNDNAGNPIATDSVSGVPIATVQRNAAVMNLSVADPQTESYTLNKIATFGANQDNMTYFDLDYTSILDKMQDGFTIEVIHHDARVETTGDNAWRGLFGSADFGLWLNEDPGRYLWDGRVWPGAAGINYGVNEIAANVWHHTIFVYNASEGTYQVYTDGVVEIDLSCGQMRTSAITKCMIGGRYFSDGVRMGLPWGGDMALFRIYDDAASKDEASLLYVDIKPQVDALNAAAVQ